jgi:GTPase SAR1 family protein
MNRDQHRQRLILFYKKYAPENLPKVDAILSQYVGKEEQLFALLRQKYTGGMLGGRGHVDVDPEDDIYPTVIEGLKNIYYRKIKPVEEYYRFHEFYSPLLKDADFESKPMVLLLGQYSVGKTTFIRYLLQRDFPGIRIGPEPTTDKFVCIMDGPDERIIPGNALAMQADKPFTPLQKFGMAFLNRLECAQVPAPITRKITIVDSPGILSGEKQRVNRGYNFNEVVEWFAAKCDRILLLFDAHKLDISDEFRSAILMLKGQDDKVRVVMNKADRVTSQQLMRVYGALMWSLGKVVNTPEVLRVYISSFWDEPYAETGAKFTELFDQEKLDLMADLKGIPRNSTVRKINEIVKRARKAKVHAFLIASIKARMPAMFGRAKAQQQVLADLPDVFFKCKKEHNLCLGDFPDMDRFRDRLEGYDDFKKSFRSLKPKMLEDMESVLSTSIPKLMRQLPSVNSGAYTKSGQGDGIKPAANPFAAQESDRTWIVGTAFKQASDNVFYKLRGSAAEDGGRVMGVNARHALVSHGKGSVGDEQLFKIWQLCDKFGRGGLDDQEFALALYLIDAALEGKPVPSALPEDLVPPCHKTDNE